MTGASDGIALRAFSYGGGVQSSAALVLAARSEIDYPLFLFANVGADSENPKTLAYVSEVAAPFAERHGIELVELRKIGRDGQPQTLLGHLRHAKRSVPIPARMSDTGAPGNRRCTHEFKIAVIRRELRKRGATPANPAVVGLGISTDEIHRLNTESRCRYQINAHPLIDLRLSRQDCRRIIESAGLPVPPKSSCYFCPFHSGGEWQRLARQQPDLFSRSVEIERMLIERRRNLGKDPVYLTRFGRPLNEVYDGNQTVLFEDDADACESGYCMT